MRSNLALCVFDDLLGQISGLSEVIYVIAHQMFNDTNKIAAVEVIFTVRQSFQEGTENTGGLAFVGQPPIHNALRNFFGIHFSDSFSNFFGVFDGVSLEVGVGEEQGDGSRVYIIDIRGVTVVPKPFKLRLYEEGKPDFANINRFGYIFIEQTESQPFFDQGLNNLIVLHALYFVERVKEQFAVLGFNSVVSMTATEVLQQGSLKFIVFFDLIQNDLLVQEAMDNAVDSTTPERSQNHKSVVLRNDIDYLGYEEFIFLLEYLLEFGAYGVEETLRWLDFSGVLVEVVVYEVAEALVGETLLVGSEELLALFAVVSAKDVG
jgi:hypothetical protein